MCIRDNDTSSQPPEDLGGVPERNASLGQRSFGAMMGSQTQPGHLLHIYYYYIEHVAERR